MKHKKFYAILPVIFMMASIIISCDETENEETGVPWDPTKPVVLTSFSPDSGRIRGRVILEGDNFGSTPENIRVYFNDKRAAVVGSNGKKVYVITPRIAANVMCDVSVVVGNDSVVYPQQFRYNMVVQVTTVVGNGTYTNRMGPLETATIGPFQLDVDANDNIFVGVEGGFDGGPDQVGFVRINEAENIMELLMNLGTAGTAGGRFNGINCDKFTGMIYTKVNNPASFVTCDEADYWVPRHRTITSWVENPDYPVPLPPPVTGESYMGYNQFDKYCYTRFQTGYIIRIDPRTGEAMVLYRTPEGADGVTNTSIGIDFDPKDPDWCYVACYNQGRMAHGIYRFNIKDAPNTWERLNDFTSAGHRDGPIKQAMFRTPYGLRFDMDGNAYISDQGNHCIRKYTPATGMVETVLGIPGRAGFMDGGPEDALFNNPTAVGVSLSGNVYVADRSNRRVRKLAIE